MGNTNLPQFGAADSANSRDTFEGDKQLTEEQKKQLDKQAPSGLGSLLPKSVANESPRVVEHADHGKNVIEKPFPKPGEQANGNRKQADLQPTDADYAALAGHVGTGHSPSDAT